MIKKYGHTLFMIILNRTKFESNVLKYDFLYDDIFTSNHVSAIETAFLEQYLRVNNKMKSLTLIYNQQDGNLEFCIL